jgi:ankyrin repeat protein
MAADNRNPNPEMITALIKAGGDVNERDKFGLTPLMLAAGNENSTPEVITAIIKTESSSSKASVNINALDENGKTPLIEAAQKNSNPKVIITLLQLGANTIVKDDSGKTAIDYARENRRLNDADTLQKLQNKEYAVPLNTSKQQRATMSDYSFLELCKNGTLQQINNAIKNGANVNARNSLGETPLMLAAFNNSTPEVIAVLVTAGADINAKNNQGVAASDYLRRNERFITSIARRMEDETPAPRSRGFIDYSINDFRFVDLCSIGTFQEIFEAINNGANVNARGSNGMTPLIAAARSRYTRLEVIRILIDAGADINARDIDGMTPLISAARYNINPDMITALLGSGANPRIRDYSGRMAIDYALKNMSLVNTQALRRLEFESR